ncbi:MAG: purple acid phosphatase family protein [Candidatus Helarchaeota archaeon]
MKKAAILAIKKFILFIVITVAFFGLLHLNHIHPSIFNPDLKYPILTFIGDTRTSMGVSFQTPVSCKTAIYYGENTSLKEGPIIESHPRSVHKFNLTGLKPNTQYYYLINSTSVNYDFMNKIFYFKTGVDPSSDTAFKFTLVGDTRPDHWGITQHSWLVKKMLEKNPNFIFNVGDIVSGPSYAREWDEFFYEVYPCTQNGVPYMVSMGNHEEHEGPGGMEDKGRTYLKYMHLPGTIFYYAFNYSNAAFVSLNLADPKNITQSQINWLNNTLFRLNKSSEIDWIFVFSHYPPYSSTENYPSIIQQIVPLIEKYKVDLYFAGHHHHYERLKVNNTIYIISGGGGAETDLYVEPSKWTITSWIGFQYCEISVNGKNLNFNCYSQQNVLIDHFNLTAWRNS